MLAMRVHLHRDDGIVVVSRVCCFTVEGRGRGSGTKGETDGTCRSVDSWSPSRQKQVPEPFFQWRCPVWEGREGRLVAGSGGWLGNRRDL